jgi:hypothetical protein
MLLAGATPSRRAEDRALLKAHVINDFFYAIAPTPYSNLTPVDGGQTASYTYDALNHRVQTVAGGATTEHVFNAAGQRVSEWNGATDAQLKGHYYWGAKPVAYYTTAAGRAGLDAFRLRDHCAFNIQFDAIEACVRALRDDSSAVFCPTQGSTIDAEPANLSNERSRTDSLTGNG